MKRMKTFFIYVLLIAALWIFSDIVIYLTVNGTFKDKEAKVFISSPEVTISESKATYINGCVKGIIKNNAEEVINNKYLKIDMYSERDVNLGTKYVKIEKLQPSETKEFEMWYEYTDVDYVIIRTTDKVPNLNGEEFSSQNLRFGLLFGKLMLLYFM